MSTLVRTLLRLMQRRGAQLGQIARAAQELGRRDASATCIATMVYQPMSCVMRVGSS